MDPWKPIRLWLCSAGIVAFLAAGGWARFWYGVPGYPYGEKRLLIPRGLTFWGSHGTAPPRSANPFEELESMHRSYQRYGPHSTAEWPGRKKPLEWISVPDDW